jgi:hypothetical protein
MVGVPGNFNASPVPLGDEVFWGTLRSICDCRGSCGIARRADGAGSVCSCQSLIVAVTVLLYWVCV